MSREDMNDILKSFKIEANCIKHTKVEHIENYDLEINSKGAGTVKRIENNLREISLNLKSYTIPIMDVKPSDGVVRLQVATRKPDTKLHSLLYFGKKIPEGALPVIIGTYENGDPLWMSIHKNPHLIVAGSTGSGKSTLLHNIISGAIYLNLCNARSINIHLIDPKRVEFSFYNTISNVNIVNNYSDTIVLFRQLVKSMEETYKQLEQIGMKSVENCYHLFRQNLIVIDEMADLSMQDEDKTLHNLIVTIAQKGRAAGFYIVLATQRPSVDVLPGIIKANFPARIACKTATKTDSKVVLDKHGAESLMGRGDAIINSMDHDFVRFQVCWTDFNQIKQMVFKLSNNMKDK